MGDKVEDSNTGDKVEGDLLDNHSSDPLAPTEIVIHTNPYIRDCDFSNLAHTVLFMVWLHSTHPKNYMQLLCTQQLYISYIINVTCRWWNWTHTKLWMIGSREDPMDVQGKNFLPTSIFPSKSSHPSEVQVSSLGHSKESAWVVQQYISLLQKLCLVTYFFVLWTACPPSTALSYISFSHPVLGVQTGSTLWTNCWVSYSMRVIYWNLFFRCVSLAILVLHLLILRSNTLSAVEHQTKWCQFSFHCGIILCIKMLLSEKSFRTKVVA